MACICTAKCVLLKIKTQASNIASTLCVHDSICCMSGCCRKCILTCVLLKIKMQALYIASTLCVHHSLCCRSGCCRKCQPGRSQQVPCSTACSSSAVPSDLNCLAALACASLHRHTDNHMHGLAESPFSPWMPLHAHLRTRAQKCQGFLT